MKTTALLLALTTVALAADPAPPKTLIAQPDKLIFADDFSSTFDTKAWKSAKGKWEIADAALRGAEIKADKHGAVTRRTMVGPMPRSAREYTFRCTRSRS